MASGMTAWQYYNHAVFSALTPHETPDLACLEMGEVWNILGVCR